MCCNGFVICMWSPYSFQNVLSLIYCTCVLPNLLYLFCPQFVIFVLSLIYVVIICCRSINMVQDAVPKVAPPPQKKCVVPLLYLCHPHEVWQDLMSSPCRTHIGPSKISSRKSFHLQSKAVYNSSAKINVIVSPLSTNGRTK